MKTAVLMKRSLFDVDIKQNSKTNYLSATDLMKAGNRWRVSNGMDFLKLDNWKNLKSTKEFLSVLKEEEGKDVFISARGRGQDTWVHPFVFIDLALWINPSFKITVYKWLYDSLIEYRNSSGDSYRKMCGALWLTTNNQAFFKKDIQEVAGEIRTACGVTDWQEATENQLKLRDKIHEYISIFADMIRDRDALLEVAIKKAKENN